MKFNFPFKKYDINSFLINLVKECILLANSVKKNFIKYKEDGSPITQLDLALDKLIYNALASLQFEIPIVSEEREHSDAIYKNTAYWLVDPLDGTRSFINGNSEYTINIALIYKDEPVLGIIGHPPSNKIWVANNSNLFILENNKIIYNNSNNLNVKQTKTIITSRHVGKKLSKFINYFDKYNFVKKSSSLKFCILAEGKAVLYPRLEKISKWDIAAGHAIVNAAGGKLYDFNKNKISYKSETKQTSPFFALSNTQYEDEVFLNYKNYLLNS